mmetsp:Transcript_40686/g.62073  ORF Transcript_40686/g.62073 Transcript_40686/m.62073 type:complete len:81 (+) Transcript_40686:297-539(+)
MFGHQNLAEQSGVFMQENWKFDIIAETDGVLGVFPFGEFKAEIRRQPKALLKITEIAARSAYETTYFNLVGEPLNPAIKF